jgi:hypothetical protein
MFYKVQNSSPIHRGLSGFLYLEQFWCKDEY